jgi:hypothetical protein
MHVLRLFKRMFPEWSYALFGWMYANKMLAFQALTRGALALRQATAANGRFGAIWTMTPTDRS